MSNKRCLYPHSSLTIEANGDIRLCSSSLPIGNLSKNIDSIKALWESKFYTNICSTLSSGVFPKECISCKKSESESLQSRRMSFYEKRLRLLGDKEVNNHFENRSLRHLSIAFSNHCNLKCSMCGSLYSSSWRELESQAYNSGINFRKGQSSSIFEISDKQLDEILDLTQNLDTVLIKGGEPLLSKKCIRFLRRLQKSTNRPNVFIQTNGTIMNHEVLDLIGELNIDIGFSIDGVYEVYEWIRGFSFDTVVNNLKSVINLNLNSSLFVDYTTSIFNIYNLKEFLNYFSDFSAVDKISFTTIARQQYNSVRALPLNYRKEIIENIDFRSFRNLEGISELQEYALANTLSKSDIHSAYRWLEFLERERGGHPHKDLKRFLKEGYYES